MDTDRRCVEVTGADRQRAEDQQRSGDLPRRIERGERERATLRRRIVSVVPVVVMVIVGVVAVGISGVGIIVVMLDTHEVGSSAARGTEEGEVGRPCHVGGGHESADDADDVEDRVVGVLGRIDDLVFREEPAEERDAAQRSRADHPDAERDRHLLPDPAHVLLHVETVMTGGVTDRACHEEQRTLEEGVGEDVEHRGGPGADAESHHHVAELRHGRVGEHLLDVVLHERQGGGNDHGDATDHGDQVERLPGGVDLEPDVEHRVDAGDQEHPGHDHGGAVQQRTDRRRAGHRVWQPGVQRELAALADAGDEQRHRRPHQGVLAGELTVGGSLVDATDIERAEDPEQCGRADQQTDVADADGPERLEGCLAVGRLFPPVPDQQERGEPHDLPAEDQLHHVGCQHHDQHSCREQGDAGEVMGVAAIALDVLGRVDLNQRRDEGDQQQRHHSEPVDMFADSELGATTLPPGPLFDDRSDLLAVGRVDPVDPLERSTGSDDQSGDHAGDPDLAAAPRHPLSEQQDHEEGDERDDRDQPRVLQEPACGLCGFFCGKQHQPCISDSSSRAIERRLR